MSILALNNDCLIYIMTKIDDFTHFYNFSLTCKRFYAVVLRVVREWHDNVKARKVLFYAMKFMTEEYVLAKNTGPGYWPWLMELPGNAELYEATKPTLVNVLKIWRSRGPVAAELFTWINHVKVSFRVKSVCKRELTLLLPKRKQELTFQFYYTQNPKVVKIIIDFEDERERLRLTCPYQNKAGFYYQWTDEEIFRVFHFTHSGQLLDVIKEELGATSSPITGRHLLWLLFYPDSIALEPPRGDRELIFQDPTRNKEPSIESLQPALQRFEENLSLMKIVAESSNVKKIVQLLKFVNIHPNSFVVKISQYLYNIVKYMRNIPTELLMCLILRTTLFPVKRNENCQPVTEERCFSLRIKKELILHGKLVKTDHYFITDAVQSLEFQLTNGFKTMFKNTEITEIMSELHNTEDEVKEQIIGKIIPVTEFIKGGIEDETVKGLTDEITLFYFIVICLHFFQK